MSDPTLDAIHTALGQILRELSTVGTGQSELHVKVDALARTVHRIADDRMRDRFDIDRAHRRITSLEHQMALVSEQPAVPDWRPDPREITGTHDFAVIKAQVEEAREKERAREERRIDSETWNRRQTKLWLVGALGALIMLTLGGCLTYAVPRLLGPAPTQAPK